MTNEMIDRASVVANSNGYENVEDNTSKEMVKLLSITVKAHKHE